MERRKATACTAALVLRLIACARADEACNTAAKAVTSPLRMGVNLGGLFVLEDWFFSTPGRGQGDGNHVATDTPGAAIGRPYLLDPDLAGVRTWSSESDFLQSVPADVAMRAMTRHRDSYILPEVLFAKLEAIEKLASQRARGAGRRAPYGLTTPARGPLELLKRRRRR